MRNNKQFYIVLFYSRSCMEAFCKKNYAIHTISDFFIFYFDLGRSGCKMSCCVTPPTFLMMEIIIKMCKRVYSKHNHNIYL